MDLNELKTDAGIIRDASQAEENTAFRVGSWLVNLIEFLTDTTIEAVITSIEPSVTATGIVLTINYQKADGSTFSNTITLPIADATKSGLMSPEMVDKIASLQSLVNTAVAKNTEQDTAIATLQQSITNHGQSINDLDSRLDALDSLTEQINTTMETAGATAQANASRIKTLETDVTGNTGDIAALQQSIANHGQSINDLTTRADEQDATITSLSTSVTAVEQECRERQDVCDTKNSEQDTAIAALQSYDDNTTVRLEEMQLALDTAVNDITALKQRINALENQ